MVMSICSLSKWHVARSWIMYMMNPFSPFYRNELGLWFPHASECRDNYIDFITIIGDQIWLMGPKSDHLYTFYIIQAKVHMWLSNGCVVSRLDWQPVESKLACGWQKYAWSMSFLTSCCEKVVKDANILAWFWTRWDRFGGIVDEGLCQSNVILTHVLLVFFSFLILKSNLVKMYSSPTICGQDLTSSS